MKLSQKGDGGRHTVYDFVDKQGISVIKTWRAGLTVRSRAALDSKLDMLQIAGWDLPPRLLAGPISKTQHIYKLLIRADVQLRPTLCKGPFFMDHEITLLLGAIEVQWKLVPAPQVALENRAILLSDKNRRIPHERY